MLSSTKNKKVHQGLFGWGVDIARMMIGVGKYSEFCNRGKFRFVLGLWGNENLVSLLAYKCGLVLVWCCGLSGCFYGELIFRIKLVRGF